MTIMPAWLYHHPGYISHHAHLSCTASAPRSGRVMNRTARVADKAGSGHVWCTKAAVASMEAMRLDCAKALQAQSLGTFQLKGVAEPLELFQCGVVSGHAGGAQSSAQPTHS